MPMPTWVDAYNQMRTVMQKANSASPQGLPRVTNEQAASILRASMTVAEKNKFPRELVEQWYPLALSLAGWNAPGDRFLVDAAHRRRMLPDDDLPVLWQTALNVATTAQNKGVAFAAPTANPSVDYDAVLKQAWSKMQRDAKATGQPAPTSPIPQLPAPTPPDEEKSTSPWLLLAALYVISQQKKGRR